MRRISGCIVFFVLTILCTAVSAQNLDPDVEMLFGFSIAPSTGIVSMDVLSSGCTESGDFRFDLADGVLTITRIRRDACKAMPQRTTFTYSLEQAGLKRDTPFRLANPIVVSDQWD